MKPHKNQSQKNQKRDIFRTSLMRLVIA